jgi:hypothetical protein
MSHFSEMSFLFDNNSDASKTISKQSDGNTINVVKNTEYKEKYVVYKNKNKSGTNEIINYLSENVYKHSNENKNPYLSLIEDFNGDGRNSQASMRIKPSDLAYLRDLGVYPINRMAILRRFPSETYLPEDLNEIEIPPMSTIIGWIKPDEKFGKIDFSETWTKL